MKLYTYWRSSAAYRVRIALELKGLEREDVFVDLRAGEQRADTYARLNPQRLVPTLVDDGHVIGQSLAIVEYLDEVYPEPPLLPAAAPGRARVRRLALALACDTHPLQNLGPVRALSDEFGLAPEEAERWARHWIERGLGAFEALVADDPATGRFCHGEEPGLADLVLVPQVYNARRRGLDVDVWPSVERIDAACRELDAFARAAPEAQPDASA